MPMFREIAGLHRFVLAILLTGTVLFISVHEVQAQSFGRVRVFLGPVPDEHGFTRPRTKDFEDSYRDMRVAYARDPDLAQEIELVDDFSRADIAVELVHRGSQDTGQRVQAPSVVVRDKRGRPTAVVPGASSPVTAKTLDARLVVLNTNYDIELEGKVGAGSGTYRDLAKDLLRKVNAWARQNRDRLRTARPRS